MKLSNHRRKSGRFIAFATALVLACLSVLALPEGVQAQCPDELSTNLTSNNSSGFGTTLVVEAEKTMTLCRLYAVSNSTSSQTVSVTIWAHPNGLPFSKTSNPSGINDNQWFCVGTTTVSFPGDRTPTGYTEIPIDLSSLGVMSPGDKWGFLLQSSGIGYKTGSSPYIFSNGDIKIDTETWGPSGSASCPSTTSFSFPNFPRQFCGKVSYSLITAPNDVGIASIDEPMNFCAGTKDVKVTLRNYGTNQVSSATVNWSINGSPQTAYSWSGLLDTLTAATRTTQLTLGSYTFQNGTPYTIRAWSSSPNGVADTVNLNDTTEVTVQAALSGTYTIAPTGGDFSSLTAAVTALNNYGVCSAVTFNIQPGTYNETVTIDEIPGASATNTVTFNGTDVDNCIVQYNTSSSYTWVIGLNGADHVRIQNLTLNATGSTYGYGVFFTNQADSNKISGCKINVSTTSTNTICMGICASTPTSTGSSGNHANYNVIENNEIRGGYYAIRLYGGGSTSPTMGNVIRNNKITDYYYYGLSMYYQGDLTVDGNEIRDRQQTSSAYGMYIYYNHVAPEIVNNQVAAGTYGIYVYYSNRDSTSRGLIANNMITMHGTSTNYGIRVYYSHMFDVWHNSINMMTNSTGYGLYSYGSSTYRNLHHDFRNNTVMYQGTGTFYAFYTNAASYGALAHVEVDYNNSYGPNTTTRYYFNSAYTSLSAAQSAYPAYQQNNLEVNPFHYSDYDLHTDATTLNNQGTPVAVTTDFDGESRNGTTPDIGADEYTPPTLDIAFDELIDPLAVCGPTATKSVTVKLRNNAINSHSFSTNPVTVYITTNGMISQTISATINSGTLAAGASNTYTLSSTLNMNALGQYSITGYTVMTGDQRPRNDTLANVIDLWVDQQVSTFPYFEDFEADDGSFRSEIITGDVNNWGWGVPNYTGTSGNAKPITTAHSGTKVWMVGLTSGYEDDEDNAVQTPCLDFTSLSAPVLMFYMNINTENNYDALILEASSDGGATWAKINPISPAYNSTSTSGPIDPPKYSGYSTTGWNKYVFGLGAYAGESNVKIRWHFGSDGSVSTYTGVAIDDIAIGDFPEKDIIVTHVQYDNTVGRWARIENMPHVIHATIVNNGYENNPSTVPLTYKENSVPSSAADGVSETLSPAWNGNTAVVTFTTPHVPTTTGILPFYVAAFHSGDANAANDYAMTSPNVKDDKTYGFEDFELVSPPGWEKGFSVVDVNGGASWESQGASGMSGTQGGTYPGDASSADDWFFSPAADLAVGTSYSVAFQYRSRTGGMQSLELAWGTSPDPSSMTVFAQWRDFTNTSFVAAIGSEGVAPFFNTPLTVAPIYIGWHVTSAANEGPLDIDAIRLYENPTPPPKIAYGNDPDWFDTPFNPIKFSGVYKKTGIMTRTYTVISSTMNYGNPMGDMLWDVVTSTDWITLIKSSPDPLSYLTTNPFTPPWCRQYQTFTLEVNPAGLQPGVHNGLITFDAYLYNVDYPFGVRASNALLEVPVELTLTSTGGPGENPTYTGTQTDMSAAGNPWVFYDADNLPYATVNVTGGTIPSMTITSFPGQLPKHISRYRYVRHYWEIDATGTGWTADIQFHYFDSEVLSGFIQDENALVGTRIAPGTALWEYPIIGTGAIGNDRENFTTVTNINPSNYAGSIALAHPWNLGPIIPKPGTQPDAYAMQQNFPNPFNPRTQISYSVPERSQVQIIVTDLLGQEVARLVDEELAAGTYSISFDGADLGSGIYIATAMMQSLETSAVFTKTIEMTLAK
ncbi:MAG: hypothetical protein CL946_06835 [Ectothiorhodospiraceae bacterium]|nr:hypothetical protein [Ectothiorhodospiraceae bacterium]